MGLKDKFAAANTTLDGRLTKEQADAAGMKQIVRKFDELDTAKLGYLTMDQIRAFRAEKNADKAEG